MSELPPDQNQNSNNNRKPLYKHIAGPYRTDEQGNYIPGIVSGNLRPIPENPEPPADWLEKFKEYSAAELISKEEAASMQAEFERGRKAALYLTDRKKFEEEEEEEIWELKRNIWREEKDIEISTDILNTLANQNPKVHEQKHVEFHERQLKGSQDSLKKNKENLRTALKVIKEREIEEAKAKVIESPNPSQD
jgi:hypothetical protein